MLLSLFWTLGGAIAIQLPLGATMQDWVIEVSRDWDVLGPFPISAREQHFLSPSFPLDLSVPYIHEANRTWSSALADGGEVGWQTFQASESGRILVSHKHIRWEALRKTEGWAALQHHNLLHTTLKVTPPQTLISGPMPWLSCSFKQTPFFTLVPENPGPSFTPQWHPGDIYAFNKNPQQLIPLPVPFLQPTTFHLFVAGDYEIRLFGDPTAAGNYVPTLDLTVNIGLEPWQEMVIPDSNLHVVCDFIGGYAFGKALGVGVRALGGEWEILAVEMNKPSLKLSLYKSEVRFVASQTRIVPLAIHQTVPFHEAKLSFSLSIVNSATRSRSSLSFELPIRHLDSWNSSDLTVLKSSYLLNGTPTAFLTIPPLLANEGQPAVPVLALHGAGVDISDDFWPSSLPRQRYSWIVCPTGLTSWGFDWHGRSADDVWGSLEALIDLLQSNQMWSPWQIEKDTPAVLMGHSNGGQGVWHIASRYPDRVLAAIPAAAYIKSQQYIPLTLSRGAHFIDPALYSAFSAALSPDDNDIFLSNIVDVSVLAIHGGADENVPTWHSRELVGLVKTWRPDANISFLEEDGKPHWYPSVLRSEAVQNFLALYVTRKPRIAPNHHFTLTVATPSDSGSFHGFSIHEPIIPGRLARLRVKPGGDSMEIATRNVQIFSLTRDDMRRLLSVDDTKIDLSAVTDIRSKFWFQREGKSWKLLSRMPPVRASGPLSSILRSVEPIKVVVPTADTHALSIAMRISHALLLYFRVDTSIIYDVDALKRADENEDAGNVIVIGCKNAFGLRLLQSGSGVVNLSSSGFTVNGISFDEPSLGIIFVRPYPVQPHRSALFLCGTDDNGLERVSRVLLPIRSGVPLPEFLILDKDTDFMSIGGVRGAGFWDRFGDWSNEMAWINEVL